jgi:hypothetical protein
MPTIAQRRASLQHRRQQAFDRAGGCCQLQYRRDCLGPHTPLAFSGQRHDDHGYLVRGSKAAGDLWGCWRCVNLPRTRLILPTPNPNPRPDWSAAYYGN